LDDATDQAIREDTSEDTGDSTLVSDIEENDWNQQKKVLLRGQEHWNKLFHAIRDQLPKKQSHANTVTTCLPVQNSQKPPGLKAQPLPLKSQKSTLLNNTSLSDGAPSTPDTAASNV
jgi:hypothetical protein